MTNDGTTPGLRIGCGALLGAFAGSMAAVAGAWSGRSFLAIIGACTVVAAAIGYRYGDRGFHWMLRVIGADGNRWR